MIEVNEDELVGFILRYISDEHDLSYDEIRSVLDAKLEFLKEKELVELIKPEGSA